MSSISAGDITQIGRTFTPKLAAAGPLPSGKSIQLSGESNLEPKTLDHDAFAAMFANTLQWSAHDGSTAWIDYLLWSLKKPSLPPKYKSWMIELMKALEKLNLDNATSPVIPAARGVFNNQELGEWDTMSRYACMDAARFSGCCSNNRDYYYTFQIINRAYLIRESYTTRYTDYLTSEQKAPGDNSVINNVKGFSDCAGAVRTYLNKAQAGICTTFAWAAASPLIDRITKESRSKTASLLKRVEVVAYPNHIFVIVNRDGAALARNEKLPGNADWGDGVFEVDVWFATLGHPIIYKGVGGANLGFLESLKSLFDSKKFFA